MIKEFKSRSLYVILGYVFCCIYGLLERDCLIVSLENMFTGISGMYNIGVSDYFEIVIRLVLVTALCNSIPLILIESLCLLISGLNLVEQKQLIKKLILGYCCYGSILVVGLSLLVKRLEDFLINFKGNSSIMVISLFKEYYLWIEKLTLLLIILSQLPIILSIFGFNSSNRKYVYIIVVVICGIISPPEVLSQLILVSPILGLWELMVIIELRYRINL